MRTIKLYLILFLSLINLSAFGVGEHNHSNTLLSYEDLTVIGENGEEFNLVQYHANLPNSLKDYGEILTEICKSSGDQGLCKSLIEDILNKNQNAKAIDLGQILKEETGETADHLKGNLKIMTGIDLSQDTFSNEDLIKNLYSWESLNIQELSEEAINLRANIFSKMNNHRGGNILGELFHGNPPKLNRIYLKKALTNFRKRLLKAGHKKIKIMFNPRWYDWLDVTTAAQLKAIIKGDSNLQVVISHSAGDFMSAGHNRIPIDVDEIDFQASAKENIWMLNGQRKPTKN